MNHLESLSRGLRPAEKLDIATWAEKHIVLSSRQATNYAGPYRAALTPYVRPIFEALQDLNVWMIVIEKGAQTGLTLASHVWLCYLIAEDPGPLLCVMPSETLAQSFSQDRLQPMIDDSPRMRQEKPDDPDLYKKLEYRMRGCTLTWIGSNSAGNLAGRPIRYALVDEPDKYPPSLGAEGDVIDLIKQRTKSFWNRKILLPCTPTTEYGHVHRQYLRGDQRKFFIPCHACGAMQTLKWSQVRFDSNLPPDEAAAGARYECESCGAAWTDAQRIDACKKLEVRATAKAKEYGVVSFHVSSLYAPWTKISALVASFLAAKDHPEALHSFINSELGEPWHADVQRVGDDVVAERMRAYSRGELFTRASTFADAYKDTRAEIMLGVDVQKDSLRYVARLFVAGGDSGMIDYGVAYGWQEIADMADRLGALGLPVWVLVDSGYGERTQEVYEAALQFRMIPTKGSSTAMRSHPWTQTTINVFEGTKKQAEGHSIQLITFDTIALKLQLMDRLQGRGPFGWYVFSGIGEDYAKEVTAEEYSPETGKFQLKRGRRDNHFLDCEVLCLLGATIAGLNSRIYK